MILEGKSIAELGKELSNETEFPITLPLKAGLQILANARAMISKGAEGYGMKRFRTDRTDEMLTIYDFTPKQPQ